MNPLKIKNHRVEGVDFKSDNNTGSVIKPTILVLHDTAGRLDKFNSMNYMRTKGVNVSVHFTVERDGTITQSVPCNRRANHAGKSSYHGRKYCNNFSIGIEIVSPGIMQRAGEGRSRAWFGQVFDNEEHGIRFAKTHTGGGGWWMDYTPEQIEAVARIAEACVDKYDLKDIVPHWYISPGRKVDTSPNFPLDHIKVRAFGRDDDDERVERPEEVATVVASNGLMMINAPGGLNMRKWPSFNPNVITAIPHGTRVPVIKTGDFNGRSWSKVGYSGASGWVVSAYLKTE